MNHDPLKIDATTLLENSLWMRGLVASLVGEESADDIVQDTWLRVLERPPSAPPSQLKAWLSVVARNLALHHLRSEKARTKRDRETALSQPQRSLSEVERVRLHRELTDLVLELREPYRSTLILRYFDGLSTRAIARRHQTNVETVRKRISRGLAMLRTGLDDSHGSRATWAPLLLCLNGDWGRATPLLAFVHSNHVFRIGLPVAASVLLGTVLWISFGSSHATSPGTVTTPLDLSDSSMKESPFVDPSRDIHRERVPLDDATPPSLTTLDSFLRGRIKRPDGTPAEGALVEVRREPFREQSVYDPIYTSRYRLEDHFIAEVITDSRGEFKVALTPGHLCDLYVTHEPWARKRVPSRRAGESVEITLNEPATLVGQVTDATGRALRACRVFASSNDPWRLPISNTETDDEGVFTLEGLSPGSLALEVIPEGPWAATVKYVTLKEGEKSSLSIAVEPGFLLEGRVTEEASGKAVTSTRIGESWRFRKTTLTNVDGHFTLPGYAYTGKPLLIEHPFYGRRIMDVPKPLEQESVDLDVRLAMPIIAHGTIHDHRGEGIEGAYIAVMAELSTPKGIVGVHWQSGHTDETGSFFLEGLDPDRQYDLFVFKQGFGAYRRGAYSSRSPNIDFGRVILEPAASVAGRVMDSEGQPLIDCGITLVQRIPHVSRIAVWPLPRSRHTWSARTDSRGSFCFTDLGAGSYRLRPLLENDSAFTRIEFDLTAGEARHDVDVEIAVEQSLRGTVMNAKREALEGVTLTLIANGDESGTVKTDADGAFRFVGLGRGHFTLHARVFEPSRPEVYEPVVLHGLSKGTSPLELILHEARSLQGKVTDTEGQSIDGAWVFAMDEDGRILDRDVTERGGLFHLRPRLGSQVTLVAAIPEAHDGALLRHTQVPDREWLQVRPSTHNGRLILQSPSDGD